MRYLFLSLVLIAGSSMASAADRRISVSGSCFREAVPDRGAIVVTAQAVDADIKAATSQATKLYERVRDDVKRLNLKDAELTTSEYNVQELREWVKDRAVSKGFQARMGLQVATSDIQRVGEVIAIASRHSIKDVGQLRVYLSQEKERQERFLCLEEAGKDAQRKADKLAGSLGAKLGKVETLTEIAGAEPSPPVPMYAMAKMSREADTAAPTLEAGRREIRVSVQASFFLE